MKKKIAKKKPQAKIKEEMKEKLVGMIAKNKQIKGY
jgi:hypothetical protein